MATPTTPVSPAAPPPSPGAVPTTPSGRGRTVVNIILVILIVGTLCAVFWGFRTLLGSREPEVTHIKAGGGTIEQPERIGDANVAGIGTGVRDPEDGTWYALPLQRAADVDKGTCAFRVDWKAVRERRPSRPMPTCEPAIGGARCMAFHTGSKTSSRWRGPPPPGARPTSQIVSSTRTRRLSCG